MYFEVNTSTITHMALHTAAHNQMGPHMNIIKHTEARMLEHRTGKAYPCKTYATEAAAEKAVGRMAQICGAYFDREGTSARYVVFYVQAWGRWVGAIDLTEVLARKTSTGGYLGVCAAQGFYTY